MDGPANHGVLRYFADLPDLLVIALCATLRSACR